MKRAALIIAIALSAFLKAAPSTSPVADAAQTGDRDAVRSLLRQAADVNASQLTTDATVLTRASGTDREQIAATSVTGNYFRMIDATPAVGRFFSPDDVRVRRSSVCRI